MFRYKAKRTTEAKATDHVRDKVLDTSPDFEFPTGATWIRDSVLSNKLDPLLKALVYSFFESFDVFTVVLWSSVSP